MTKLSWRLYLDTSVIGGCFDVEFAEDSRRVIDAVMSGQARLLFSDVIEAELLNAPEPVRRLFAELPDSARERITFTPEVEALAREYVTRGVVPGRLPPRGRCDCGASGRHRIVELPAYCQTGQDQGLQSG